MKQTLARMLSLCLACCLLAGMAALPAAAATPGVQPAGTVMDTLLDVPILGDLLRLFTDDGTDAAQGATDEEAGRDTDENADPATDESAGRATDESARRVIAPEQWPESWMVGAVAAGGRYPAGTPESARSLTAAVTLWSAVPLADGGSLNAAAQEETNFGSLAADAVGYAVGSHSVWRQPELADLPLVAAVDGARFVQTVPAGAVLDEATLGDYLQDARLALVVVSPRKLCQVLGTALQEEDGWLQLSGLSLRYRMENGTAVLTEVCLAGLDGAQPVDPDDTEPRIALALPADLLERFGLTEADGYQDYLGGAGTSRAAAQPLTLHGALLDLPRNCDGETLAALLGRTGSTGRGLPEGAAAWSARLLTDGTAAAGTATVYVDGAAAQAVLAEDGWLTVDGLTPGSHTLQLVQGGPALYLSSVTEYGTADGRQLPVVALPEDFATVPAATPTPVPTATPAPSATPAPTATPVPTATPAPASSQTVTVTATATPAPTATPVPVVVQPTAAPSATRRPSNVEDPLAGTIIGVTPAPTLEPTATPSPTPAPTATPEASEPEPPAEQASGMLPLYIGIGVLVVCGIVVAVVVIRRRMEENGGKNNRYRRKN